MDNKMKKEVIITDINDNIHKYTDVQIVVSSTCNLVQLTFKHDTNTVYFPIVNILNMEVKEY